MANISTRERPFNSPGSSPFVRGPERTSSRPHLAAMLAAWAVLLLGTGVSPAQQSAPSDVRQLGPAEELALEQSRIADNYARLEQLMIRMAEIEAASNPERAALLKRAVQQSATRLTRSQLNSAADSLKPPAQLSRAVDQQQQAVNDLSALLQLLLSENRSDRLKNEQQRIREYLKELERIRRLESGLQGRTEEGADPQRLAGDQERIASRTEGLAKQMQQNEAETADGASQPQEDETTAGPGEEREPGDEGPSEERGGETQQGSESGQPNEDSAPNPQDSAEQPPSEGSSGDSAPQEGSQPGSPTPGQNQGESSGQQEPQQSDQNPQQNETPEGAARRSVKAAQERMKAAQKRLDEAQRKQAIAEQEQALRELEKAKAALEEILRQLREEEVERMLALLESRFRRMLQSQLKIYESTKLIDAIEADKRGREVEIRASKLSFEQSKLAVEADRALNLLREEGSSVAFPETVGQMRDEMVFVSERLSVVQVGVITQAAEEDIIAALEEMIAALQQAQKDLEEQRQQPQMQQTPADPGDRPLVDQLAELKMIRSLQLRVNKRTQRFAQLLKDINDPVGLLLGEDLQQELRKLSETQLRVHRVTRDIVLGKNN